MPTTAQQQQTTIFEMKLLRLMQMQYAFSDSWAAGLGCVYVSVKRTFSNNIVTTSKENQEHQLILILYWRKRRKQNFKKRTKLHEKKIKNSII